MPAGSPIGGLPVRGVKFVRSEQFQNEITLAAAKAAVRREGISARYALLNAGAGVLNTL